MSFTIPAGKTAALVGENGAGKSTVLEPGTHTELLAACGRYAELYAMQAERYR